MRFLYRIVEGEVKMPDDQKYFTYGVRAYRQQHQTWICTADVRDISPNRRFVQRLVQLYNRLQLDPDHLYDVVQDAVIDENSSL